MKHTTDAPQSGMSMNTLTVIGFVFAAVGIISRSVLQRGILGLGSLTPQQLLQAMDASSEMMVAATVSLVLQAVSTCAVPIFACLLVDGFAHSENAAKDILRLSALAAISEFCYNFAIGGRLIDPSSRNPVFALVLGLAVLYFCDRYRKKNLLIQILVTAAAVVWCVMLRVDDGIALIFVICVLWLLRNHGVYRNFIGASAAVVCSFMSPFYLASPMGFLVVHFYHGNREEGRRWVLYGAYPVLLVLSGIAAMVVAR